MGPKPLRGSSRKDVAEQPATARFTFLAEASKVIASTQPQLSNHLGQQALQVRRHDPCPIQRHVQGYRSCSSQDRILANTHAHMRYLWGYCIQVADKLKVAVPPRAAQQLCGRCGVPLILDSCSRWDLLALCYKHAWCMKPMSHVPVLRESVCMGTDSWILGPLSTLLGMALHWRHRCLIVPSVLNNHTCEMKSLVRVPSGLSTEILHKSFCFCCGSSTTNNCSPLSSCSVELVQLTEGSKKRLSKGLLTKAGEKQQNTVAAIKVCGVSTFSWYLSHISHAPKNCLAGSKLKHVQECYL